MPSTASKHSYKCPLHLPTLEKAIEKRRRGRRIAEERIMTLLCKLGLTLVVLVVVGAAIAMAMLVRHGVSARDQPTALEAFVARRLRHLAVPRSARQARNPVPATPDVLAEARAHFADHCAPCHGNDGSGQTEMGQHLYPKAPDMRQADTKLSPMENCSLSFTMGCA